MVETPVLYITFARPEYASQSFAAIKKARPKKLYFYSNKARANKPDEIARNEEVRSYIKQIDWDCEVKTWFRDEYVDVLTSLLGAIDWLFKNEERGIVIEEDVVASVAFFDYCDKLLVIHENNEKVWMISGDNYSPEYTPDNVDYFYSKFLMIYGWASWRNRWDRMDRELSFWPSYRKSKQFKKYWGCSLISCWKKYYWDRSFNKHASIKAWDGTFFLNMAYNNGVSIVPIRNLTADIGFVGDHINGIKNNTMELVDFTNDSYPIARHPKLMMSDKKYDFHLFLKLEIFKRLKNINKILSKKIALKFGN